MNSITAFPKDKILLKQFKKSKRSLIKIPKIINPFLNSMSQRGKREIYYENNFIINKISNYHNYDTSNDKNTKISNKQSSITTDKKIDTYFKQNTTRNSNINKTNNTFENDKYKLKGKLTSYRIKMLCSAKSKINSLTQRNIFSPILKNGFNYNYIDINSTNLVNLEKNWDEFKINNQYRNYFKYIYKELDPTYKEDLYEKEIEELNSIKQCIKDLKYYINLRTSDLCEIKTLNDNLAKELLDKNNNGKEQILTKISDKIILLREHTINICKSMKKLKYYIFSINNLGKYNFDAIAKKFDFDKNYIIKMKSELKFLQDGFAKYYFNIENDQNPFLLKASDKTKITKGDYFLRIIPLNDELRKEILDCNFYIHQELIAYQNENFNNKNFRCISPIKRDDLFLENITEKNQKINMNNTGGFITERRKEEKFNSIDDRVKKEYQSIGREFKKFHDIDVYLETNRKKRRTIDVNKIGSTNNIYNINYFNSFYKKHNSIKKKNINFLMKTENSKSETKTNVNKKESN